jgi:twitching motility protein PilJ
VDQSKNNLALTPEHDLSRPDKGPHQRRGFKDIPVGQKLGLIALALAVPIAILLIFLISRDMSQLNFALKERQGVEYIVPIRGMLEHLVQHKALAQAELSGLKVQESRLKELTALDEQIVQFKQMTDRYSVAFGSNELSNQFITTWEGLKDDFATLTPEESKKRHDALLKDILIPLIIQVGNQSNLILDPDLDSFYAMDLVVNKLPTLIENSSEGLYYSMVGLAKGVLNADDKANLNFILSQVDLAEQGVATSQRFIAESAPELKSQIDALVSKGSEAKQAYVDVINAKVLAPEVVQSNNPTQFFEAVKGTLDAKFETYDASLSILDNLLKARTERIQTNTLLTLAGVLIALLFAMALILYITQQITRPLAELNRVSQKVGRGDFSQIATIRSGDEIGQLVHSFNNSVVQLRDASQRQELEISRGQQLQTNIGQFLEIAMDIAQGDLTKRGKVSEDALGNVVDAINLMVEEISYTLKDVQETTRSVSNGANNMFNTTDTIAQSAQAQAHEAQKARREVATISTSIQQMAQTAASSAQAAERAVQASQEGRQAVNETLTGMQDIRREVQAISKRIKSLGDRSLEISEIVDTISRISRQTNLLALNAAIEASGAGEAGNRFAVVAEEVRKLAEDSAQSTQRVSALIKAVQSEVQEVVAGVETGTREVEAGYKVATQAGQRLEELSGIAQQTAQFAQAISLATTEQVDRVEQVGQVVEQMAEISLKSQDTVIQGREAAEELQTLASRLSENSHPTNDMLAASLMEGRKAKKDSPQPPHIQSTSAKTEGVKATLPGFGFLKSLTQGDKQKDHELDLETNAELVWGDTQQNGQSETSLKALSGGIKNTRSGFRFEDDSPGAKTLHDVQSNLIDFDEPSGVPSTNGVQSTNIEKMNRVRNKTLWDVSSEDDLEQVSSKPKEFIIDESNESAIQGKQPEMQPISYDLQTVSLELPFAAIPTSSQADIPTYQPPDVGVPASLQMPVQGRPRVKQLSRIQPGFSLNDRSVTQKLILSTATLLIPMALLIFAVVTQRQNTVVVLSAAITLGVSLACIMFALRQMTQPLSELKAISERVSQGDLSTLASIESHDEMGVVAQSLNHAIVQLREANQRRELDLEQSKHLQLNIADFLNVVIEIAQGDLTKRGRVSEDKLGNVVDAINLMTEEFNGLINDVQGAALLVSEGSGQMQGVTKTIAQKAQQQVLEAQKANQNVQGVIKSIRSMARNVDTSAKAAQQTLQASTMGQQSVSDTLMGMQSLRQDVQGVAVQVRQLGQHSQGITAISETISDIASQTSLLALGAALEAAGAGEAGRRFAVVADEVSRLAERSADSARQVTALVQNIQREVQMVVKHVEQSSTKADQSYQVATQAGQRLEEIAQIARQSAEITKAITQVTQEQVERVEQVGQVVQTITGLSEDSQLSVVQGGEAAERLQVLAVQLTKSLSRFKLN